ncbi:DCC1-like thiol-disulfide oxidoreductase family protein [Halorussus lipolyticus]|uniref:DCC1-like thiol-disulfide oxidoreductase family protein n=1 Tax=Halorussus lipolyticus TaxID=3034024 RepID=UPI0023E76E4B|nr:DCC1-like thiol-disulfide oxidoreductase family protein [Halorussus sp. DT80]
MSDVTLVYDDDCGFCTWWADFFAERSDFRIVGFTELTDNERERLPDDYEECSHLLADGRVYSCGESLEQAFVRSDLGDGAGGLVKFLRNFRDYNEFREQMYRAVADHRGDLGVVVSKTPPAQKKSDSDDS